MGGNGMGFLEAKTNIKLNFIMTTQNPRTGFDSHPANDPRHVWIGLVEWSVIMVLCITITESILKGT